MFCALVRLSKIWNKSDSDAFQGNKGGSRGEEGIFTSISHRTREQHVINATIFASVLALVAVAIAAHAWITLWRLQLETESRLSTITNSCKTLAVQLRTVNERVSKLTATAPSGLAVQVAELSDAVARLAKTQQRFAGKYYAQGKQTADPQEPAQLINGVDDPELAAELALQNAPSAGPGR